jgi:hypothetical protein
VKSAELVLAPAGAAAGKAVTLKAPEESATPVIKRAGKS